MIKEVKFIDSDNCKLFIGGCLHLGHECKGWDIPLWKMRGYKSQQEMTRGIIRQINELCSSNDYLLVLGDFCLNTSREQFLHLINQIAPKLMFIRGNHNSPWQSMYFEHCIEKFGYEVVGYEWLDKITYLGDYIDLSWNKQKFVCNHYPFYIFDKMRHGVISLTSHSHGSCQLSHPDNTQMKQIDCGWDVWMRPISFQEIMECANKKQIFKGDGHH